MRNILSNVESGIRDDGQPILQGCQMGVYIQGILATFLYDRDADDHRVVLLTQTDFHTKHTLYPEI